MKIHQAWDAFYTYSGKTSDISRNLSFVGIATIWFFQDKRDISSLPADLKIILAIFVFALGVDLIQYLLASIIWGCYSRKEEKRLGENAAEVELSTSYYINSPANVLYLVKIIFVGVAYYKLIIYFLSS